VSRRPIRIYPDPILRVDCPPVARFDAALRELVDEMIETMHAAPGVGLAAPQIGVERSLCVIDLSLGDSAEGVHVFVNPQILEAEGSWEEVEGCLSIPELTEKIERPYRVRVRALDAGGEPFEMDAEGWLARAICHEVDHLRGVLFVDRLRGLRRDRARRHLKRLSREIVEVEA
jgi:peptide deformylase